MIENWFALEPLLVERIKSRVPTDVLVAGIQDESGVSEATLGNAAILIMYHGDRPGDSAGHGAASIDYQQWLIWVAVKNATQGDGGAAKRASAGRLIVQVKRALSGWEPNDDFDALKKIPAPRPGYTAAFGYFPLAYETYLIDGE